jgi:hypothetical protein
VVNGIDLAGEGGLVWWKNRTLDNGNGNHRLCDTERGVNKPLISNGTYAEGAQENESVTSFNDDGYVYNNGQGGVYDYVSWTFRKAPKFFDVVTYTGDGVSAYREIPHKLGCRAGMIIIKRVDSNSDWVVQHIGNNHMAVENKANYVLHLNTSELRASSGYTINFSDTYFNVVGQNQGIADNRCTNLDGAEYVAYVFAHDESDESMIKCGSFLGADKTVELGWEPQWVLYKHADKSGTWRIMDTMRGMPNVGTGSVFTTPTTLLANEPSAEAPSSQVWTTSTGFHANNENASATFIYMAIRRPNKPADEFEPEELFAVQEGDGSSDPGYLSGFPVDAVLNAQSGGGDHLMVSRMTSQQLLVTSSSAAEASNAAYTFDYSDGWFKSTTYPTAWANMWRRAPGFFDVVAYEGNGVAGREVKHNLSVPPEMIWLKTRTFNDGWVVWNKYLSDPLTKYLSLNNDFPESNQSSTPQFGGAMPTDSFFKVGIDPGSNNASSTYIAYLFASVPGISKVGSYTGDGQLRVIDCGFDDSGQSTIGLLVKRTDANGDWAWHYTWTSGAYLAGRLHLNEASAGAKQNDLDAGFGGFRLQPTSPYNIDGAKYIYYAIAE